jgi:Arc/MetJ-type ribon-helix-helix transcriptional regulator
MTLTVRLPDRVEQELADYCVKHRISKSEAVKQALVDLLATNAGKPTAYDLGKDLFGPQTDAAPTEDLARHSQRRLREHFRGKKGSKRKAMGAK